MTDIVNNNDYKFVSKDTVDQLLKDFPCGQGITIFCEDEESFNKLTTACGMIDTNKKEKFFDPQV